MLTPRGATLTGASLALAAIGFVLFNGVLISLGAAGLLLLFGAFLMSRWNLRRLALSLRAPARVYADKPFDLRLNLENRRTVLDAFGISIHLKLSHHASINCHANWTAAGSRSIARMRGSIPGRGAFRSHPFTLESIVPLGLFRTRASGLAEHEILVFPRPLTPAELFTSGALHDASLLPGSTPGHAPGEPRGIRPWQPGDPAKRIHWPATARSLNRRRGLRMRENDPPGFYPQHCTVVFHSFGTSGELIRSDRFEWALSLTCGTLRYLREHGIPTTFLADFNEWQPLTVASRSSFASLLVNLARAERQPGTEAHDVVPIIDAVPENHSLVILSDMPPAGWVDSLPPRPAVLVDVRQHRYGPRRLHTTEQTPDEYSVFSIQYSD